MKFIKNFILILLFILPISNSFGAMVTKVQIKQFTDNNDVLQGIEFNDMPAFSFQGHPEASPGPQEIQTLFNKFRIMVEEHAKT